MNADPLSVICPLCGALPTEACFGWDVELGAFVEFRIAHFARRQEADRVQALDAENVVDSL